MTVFIFTALIVFAAYEFINLHWPDWVGRNATSVRVLIAAIIIVSIVGEFVAASAFVYAMHPSYGWRYFASDLVFGKFSLPIFLGVAAGILFGVVANSVLANAAVGTMSMKTKALASLLGVVFLLGIGGEALLQDATRRISKFSLGGAEVTFYDPAALRRGRLEGDPSLGSGYGDPLARAPAVSLEFFKVLPGLIKRDKTNIEAARLLGSQTTPFDGGRFDVAREMAGLMVAPIGSCLLEIHKQTGDIDFIRATLSGLLPPLRGLGILAHPNADAAARFGKSGADAFLNALRQTLVFAEDHKTAIPSLDPVKPGSACRVLSQVLCANTSWMDKRAKLPEQSNAVELGPDRLSACYKAALLGASGDNKLKGDIESYLRDFASKQDFHARPYMAMITATIFAQLGQYEAGIAHLDVWLRKQTASTVEAKWLQLRALNIAIYISSYWIRAEGTNASTILRDFHLGQLQKALAILDELFEFGSEMRNSRHHMTLDDFVSTSFSRPPPETPDCKNANLKKVKAVLGAKAKESLKNTYAWYVERTADVAHHQLSHPEYAKLHSHTVNTAVRDVLLTDLGCFGYPNDKLAFRAHTLRLLASMQLQDAIALRATLPKSSVLSRLDVAARATDLGIIMLRAAAEDQLQKKKSANNTTPALERLANTTTVATYEELLRVKAQVADARANLD